MPPRQAFGLQKSVLPRVERPKKDPDKPMGLSAYKPANLHHSTFENTSDAYMYDVVYDAFLHDRDFWDQWNVVDSAPAVPDRTRKQTCAKCGTSSSSSGDRCEHCGHPREPIRAPIRVVMDLPVMHKLPLSYPPSLPGQKGVPRPIPGLPEGYSVPLECHTVEEGIRLLEMQKMFHGGSVEPRYKWLEDIISRVQEEHEAANAALADQTGSSSGLVPRPKQKTSSNTGFLSFLTDTVLGDAGRRPTKVEEDVAEPVRVDPFSRDLDAGTGASSKSIIERNLLVNAYRTPGLATGPFSASGESRSRMARDDVLPSTAEDMEGEVLDAKLDSLLARTLDMPSGGYQPKSISRSTT